MIELNPADVLEHFALLSGLCEGAQRYLPLCADAAAEVERNERENCPTQALALLTAAAAALANYRYALAQTGASGLSFTAGDVKAAPGTANLKPARQLWRESAAAASPYLLENTFLFGRIAV